jgi:alpha-beta hydrolase superfamily lysophospholipase
MLVNLVQVAARDGVRLHGALELPESGSHGDSQPSIVDAWLCIHGTGSNFYSASTLAGLAPKLLAGGAAVLRANTRGHDMVCTGPSAGGRWLQGAAFERVDESPLDLTAWIDFLTERGFARIGILGHSLGAVKAIFTLARDDAPRAAALVAISPPRLSYSYFCQTPRAEAFRRTFTMAEELVEAGRGDELLLVDFPLKYYVSAAGYVDRYGPQEQYDILKLLDRLPLPTLLTYGSSEMQADFAFRGMSEAAEKLATAANCLQVAVIAGADHIYTGCHDALAQRIGSWLARSCRPRVGDS